MNDALDELPLSVDRRATTPLAVQVADGLRTAATAGRLRAGDRLPSSRALATRLGVSRTVITAAYDQLHAEGWLSGRHGSGTYLSASPAPRPERHPIAAEPDPEDTHLDLAAGAPCVEAIDRAAWRRAWRAAGDRIPLARRDRAGDAEYRVAIAEQLLRHRGLGAGSDTVVLATSGASDAVGELAAAVLRPGATVAMEDPGYQRAVGAFRAAGVRVLPVPVDGDGLRVDAVPAGVDAVYCTPAHQFPLGARMPAARRVALIEFARRTGALVIEDDYDGELRYDTAPLPLLATLGPDVVVHLGTTSKILSPVLGIGWLVGPPRIAEAVLAYREFTGTGPATTGQHVVVELARHSDLARHLRRLRREMPPRRAIVVDELRCRGFDVVGDDAGSHVVAPLPSALAERRVIAAAWRRGVLLEGLSRHHIGPQHTFGIPLGYAAVAREDLPAAVRVVAECLVRAGHAGQESAGIG
ncbi:MocR-like pyridoxine biosynthesis transcription factor PdxR [Nocardia pseudobrasiliensis]|uniref:GntR family transcriptional regulator/MocR family aminotransferase n=1 Tax=Nocardia pseudobrasiliensis TaxID=45979 RepID=A0A370I7C5_9NOCA|nr:PLP-dependent aminotransferase family protein [Nocardia pseudobrasiliensis]RDI66627.1 GntR family transcriptional regulator/MocR family aminotransferase [Nocardia pseudobrasiliensis]